MNSISLIFIHSPGMYPSLAKYEQEVVAMTAGLLGREHCPSICGTSISHWFLVAPPFELDSMLDCADHVIHNPPVQVTSGGSESIMLAIKTTKDWMMSNRPSITRPTIVACTSGHASVNKAAEVSSESWVVMLDVLICAIAAYVN
jgi:glutamate/tyrosine decarboxylase-like PLP-dependent enzyme